MPALIATKFTGRITWLGTVPDRAAGLPSLPLQSLRAGFDGPEGEDHGGLTRPSCSRVLTQYPRDTEIRNVRQFSVISAEELAEIARAMGVGSLDPALLGSTMVIEGIPDFSHIPPSSRLQAASGATLTVDMENRPCQLPAREIEKVQPGHGKLFKSAAKGRRGVTAWVEREGTFSVGEEVRLHVPSQPAWAHMEAALEGAKA
ncbi:MOSC domain-containing protein [Oceanicola sp. S124]|uniref:MOSC domain-containing protein n=1 Tax=Oceanicola sp. S124 TaxID=1042378 RepID=UPI00025579EB|nr:MOSC domain-containing protein [Oceanicola sp. S124]